MSRRIDIELTSSREDGSWTWRAAGAREPRGTVEGAILPSDAHVGQVLRAEVEGYLDGLSVVSVTPPKAPKPKADTLELKSSGGDQPLVTSTLAPRRSGERGRRNDRGRDRGDRSGGRRDRRGGRDRQEARHDRPSRPAPPPIEEKPKPKRLRPGKAHRSALLEAVPAEQRPIVEQLFAGGIPAVRQAIDKQNDELRAAGKPEVGKDALLRVAEELRPRALAAVWRDRAEAAAAIVDDIDLRDLRSVVNAAGDAGRDDEARALAAQLREALANRVEKEHAAWLAELGDTVRAGRVVRALRLSSRPPKAGAPIPGDIATQLAEATAASLTSETGPERWATVLDALAYSPVRRRVIPQSLPTKLTSDLRNTIARLATRLPEIAHIFDIEPDPNAERPARGQARRRPARKGDDRKRGDKPRGEGKGDRARGDRKADKPRGEGKGGGKRGKAGAAEAKAGSPAEAPAADAQPDPSAEPATDAPATDAPATEAPAGKQTDAAPAAEAPTDAPATTQQGGADAAPDAEAQAPDRSDAAGEAAAAGQSDAAPAAEAATDAPAGEQADTAAAPADAADAAGANGDVEASAGSQPSDSDTADA